MCLINHHSVNEILGLMNVDLDKYDLRDQC